MPSSGSARPSPQRLRDQPPRERILAVANDLFYRRGIRNVGIDEIIATAGVAKASLYNHFASKDELIAEYVRRRGADWWEWFRNEVEARSSTSEGRLMAAFDVLGDWLAEAGFRGCALQNTSVELADRAHPAHQVVVTNKRGLRAYLTELATGAGHGEPAALAEQLSLLMEGAIITAALEGTATPAVTAREAAERLLQRN